MTPEPRTPPLRLLFLFVFISGASGLVYEIVWVRALGRHFGTSAPAVTTVLAAFMAGLALGNALIGRFADRDTRPIRLYRRLELGIGLFGLVGSLVLLHGDPLLATMARLTAASGPLEAVVRFLFFSLLLLLPTTLMGGTLPVLARALVEAGASGRVSGTLYAVNTAGAVVGALAPDLLLVPGLGLTSTVAVAALGNLTVAVLVGRFDTGERPLGPAPAQPERFATSERADSIRGLAGAVSTRGPYGAVSTRVPYGALLLFGVSGFCAMGVQVLWSRVLEHWVAGIVTSFAVLLAIFLVGLAAGSWTARAVSDRVASPLTWAAAIQALVGPAVLLPLAFADRWLAGYHRLFPISPAVDRPGLARILADALAHALFLEGLACFLMGAAFPFLAAVAVRKGSAGRQTGQLYAVNTLAGVAGSIAAGFLLLPRLGLQSSFLLLGAISAVAGSLVALAALRSHRGLALASALGPASVLVVLLLLPADHLRRSHFTGQRGEIVAVYEGSTTTAAVVRRFWHGELAYKELLTPGVTMSATNLESRRYMGMMGHLGLLFARQPRSALLICYGVGNTAASLLSHPELEQLHVVDIAAEVLEASAEFTDELGLDPLDEPRVEAFVDDGRHHLVTSAQTYDVITSEPPPPTYAGVVNLYSREYYRLARRRLRAGGVLTQWLPLWQLSAEETSAIVAAFVDEMPHAALFYGWAYQWILVGSDLPLEVDLASWRRRVERPEVAADLETIGIDGLGDLVGSLLQVDRGLRSAVEGVRPVSDDFPIIQYPWRRLLGVVEVPEGLVGNPWQIGELLSDESEAQELAAYGPFLEVTREVNRALPWSRMWPSEWWELAFGTALRPAISRRPEHDATLSLLELNDDRIRAAQAAAERGGEPRAELAIARRLYYDGRYEEAMGRLELLAQESVNPAHLWLLRAGCARALGRSEEAAAAFTRAAELSPWPPFRIAVQALAETAADPYPPELGPLGTFPE